LLHRLRLCHVAIRGFFRKCGRRNIRYRQRWAATTSVRTQ
jgi:hypothetical protein